MSASDTETPEETVVDPAERGGAAWLTVCIKTLSEEDGGYDKLLKFVRRFKKKGGADGGPGDLEALTEDLKQSLEAVGDLGTVVEDFLEDPNGDGEGCSELMCVFNNIDQEKQIEFMNKLNRIKWIQDEETKEDD